MSYLPVPVLLLALIGVNAVATPRVSWNVLHTLSVQSILFLLPSIKERMLQYYLFCFAFDCFSKLYIPNSYLFFLLLKSCLLVGKPLHELFMVAAYPFNLLLGRRLAACTRVLAWNRSLLLSFLLFLLGSLCLVNYSLDTPAYGLLLFLFCKPFKSRLFFLLSFKLRIFFGLLFF